MRPVMGSFGVEGGVRGKSHGNKGKLKREIYISKGKEVVERMMSASCSSR